MYNRISPGLGTTPGRSATELVVSCLKTAGPERQWESSLDSGLRCACRNDAVPAHPQPGTAIPVQIGSEAIAALVGDTLPAAKVWHPPTMNLRLEVCGS